MPLNACEHHGPINPEAHLELPPLRQHQRSVFQNLEKGFGEYIAAGPNNLLTGASWIVEDLQTRFSLGQTNGFKEFVTDRELGTKASDVTLQLFLTTTMTSEGWKGTDFFFDVNTKGDTNITAKLCMISVICTGGRLRIRVNADFVEGAAPSIPHVSVRVCSRH